MSEQVNGTSSLPLSTLLQPDYVFTACRGSFDTAAAAAGIALDAAQKVTTRQLDVAQQTAVAFSRSVQALGNAASPVDALGGQAEFLRVSWEHAFAGTREVASILRDSSEATLSLLRKRVAEAMDGFGRTTGAA
jgi:phasin family protein